MGLLKRGLERHPRMVLLAAEGRLDLIGGIPRRSLGQLVSQAKPDVEVAVLQNTL